MIDGLGLSFPELYCYYCPEARYIANSDCAHNVLGVCRILKDRNVKECVVKPAESMHGDGVCVVSDIFYKDDDAFLTLYDGSQILLSSLLQDSQLIFERTVHQTEQMAALNSTSVNTIRFMTTLYPSGEAKIIATWFKIGRAGMCVDNAGNGGNVDGCVDIETGELKNAVQFNGWRDIKEVSYHPDNHAQINGVIINNWESIKEQVVRLQQSFPYCKAAGWDIALTDDGPVVIEVNDLWDTTGQMFVRKGWRKEIRDCYFAWQRLGRDYSMRPQQQFSKVVRLKKIVYR